MWSLLLIVAWFLVTAYLLNGTQYSWLAGVSTGMFLAMWLLSMID